eukprot:1147659-Pelagomonas_calceolata.AAC.1
MEAEEILSISIKKKETNWLEEEPSQIHSSMFGGTRDNFATLNKILDQPHVQAGAVRKACWAVEDCIAQNR